VVRAVDVRVVFFFQAEDGIRDGHVTGVQACALPIYAEEQDCHTTHLMSSFRAHGGVTPHVLLVLMLEVVEQSRVLGALLGAQLRSEERRVGKECRSRWWAYHEKKMKDTKG